MISYATMFVRLQTSADIFCGCLLVRAGWRVRPSYFKEAGSLRFSVWGGLENGKRVLKMKFTLRSLNFNLSWSSQVHALKVCHPVMQSQHESLDHDTLPTCLNPTSIVHQPQSLFIGPFNFVLRHHRSRISAPSPCKHPGLCQLSGSSTWGSMFLYHISYMRQHVKACVHLVQGSISWNFCRLVVYLCLVVALFPSNSLVATGCPFVGARVVFPCPGSC